MYCVLTGYVKDFEGGDYSQDPFSCSLQTKRNVWVGNVAYNSSKSPINVFHGVMDGGYWAHNYVLGGVDFAYHQNIWYDTRTHKSTLSTIGTHAPNITIYTMY